VYVVDIFAKMYITTPIGMQWNYVRYVTHRFSCQCCKIFMKLQYIARKVLLTSSLWIKKFELSVMHVVFYHPWQTNCTGVLLTVLPQEWLWMASASLSHCKSPKSALTQCNNQLAHVHHRHQLLTRRPASADRTARCQFQAGLRDDVGL